MLKLLLKYSFGLCIKKILQIMLDFMPVLLDYIISKLETSLKKEKDQAKAKRPYRHRVN